MFKDVPPPVPVKDTPVPLKQTGRVWSKTEEGKPKGKSTLTSRLKDMFSDSGSDSDSDSDRPRSSTRESSRSGLGTFKSLFSGESDGESAPGPTRRGPQPPPKDDQKGKGRALNWLPSGTPTKLVDTGPGRPMILAAKDPPRLPEWRRPTLPAPPLRKVRGPPPLPARRPPSLRPPPVPARSPARPSAYVTVTGQEPVPARAAPQPRALKLAGFN